MADATILAIPLPAGGDERSQAELLAARYHAEFVDLKNFKIQHELLRTVPVELMFRYNFVPIEQRGDALVIAVSDPSRLMILDEIAGLLAHRIIPRVATLSQITDLLKKTEQSQRVLDEASEGLTFDVLTGDENADENISIEKLTSEEDISPIIRLVDTTIFTALERRASDIHIETYDDSVHVKYRIDGVLQEAMAPDSLFRARPGPAQPCDLGPGFRLIGLRVAHQRFQRQFGLLQAGPQINPTLPVRQIDVVKLLALHIG